MWRRLFILVAALAGALFGAAFALRSDRVTSGLRQRVERLAAERFGFDVRIGALAIELWPLRLRLTDVLVLPAGRPGELARIARAGIAVHPWPSSTGALVINVLELADVRIDAHTYELVDILRRHTGEGRAVDIHTLALSNATIHIAAETWEIDVERLDAHMTPGRDGRRAVDFEVAGGRVRRGDRLAEVGARVRGTLAGTLDRLRSLTGIAVQLRVDETELSAQGSVELAQAAAVDLEVSGTTNLATLGELVEELPALAGKARFALRWQGPLPASSLRARAKVSSLGIAGEPLGDLEFDARWQRDRVEVEAFRLEHPRAGVVTGSGRLQLAAGLPVRGAVRLHEVSLPEVIAAAGLPGAWVDARVGGDAELEGTLAPLRLRFNARTTVDGFRALDRSYLDPEAVAYLQLEPVSVSGVVGVTGRAVTIESATIARGTSSVVAQGTLYLDTAAGMELSAAGDAVDLAELGAIAFVSYSGRGALAATIEGPYPDLTITGTTRIDGLALSGVRVGDTRATLVFSKLVLRIDRVSGRRGGGSFAAAGQIDFSGAQALANAHAALHGIEAADLLAGVGGPLELARALRGKVSGELRVEGALLAPEITGALSGPSLRLAAADLGALSLTGRYDGAAHRLSAEIDVRSQSGVIAAMVAYEHPARLTLDGRLDQVALANIAPLLGGIDIAGTASAAVHLEGPPGKLSGRIEADAPALATYGTHLGATRLIARVAEGEATVTGSADGASAEVEARLHLSRHLPYTLTASFTDAALRGVWPELAWLDARASGTLFSQGQLTNPDSLLADIALEQLTLSAWGVSAAAVRPVRLQYAAGALHVLDAAFAGPGVRAGLSGRASADGKLDLVAMIRAELDAARASWSRLSASRGRLEGRLTVSGMADAPSLFGTVTLEEGVVQLRDHAQALEGVAARIVFAGRNVRVESATARLGGGQVVLAGQVALPPGRAPELDLYAEFDDVTMRPMPQMQANIRGDLRLLGSRDHLQLSGDVEIQSLRYTANVELERLIPRRHAPPLKVAALDLDPPVRLAVHVSAPNDVLVTNSVLEAELEAELTVTGTTEHVGLVGSLTPLWARARYQDNVFTVERASILFTDEYRLFTEFDLRARTQACGMQVIVDIQGSSDGYNVIPSGTDETGPVSAQDVLACLQFGLRLRDFRGPDAPLLADRLPASSLDALWAVSGLDEQVRRLVPIVDELRLSSRWSPRSKRTTPRIVVGKELGRDLQLTYSRALDVADDQMLSIEYRLSALATMHGTWNTASDAQVEDLGLDLRLRWQFE